MQTVWHTSCGLPAFLYDGDLVEGEVVDPAKATHIDGGPILPDEVAVCDSCGVGVRFDRAHLYAD